MFRTKGIFLLVRRMSEVSLSQGTVGGTSADGAEMQLNKYKRLLTLARSSLEANQQTLAAKDAEILELKSSLSKAGAKSAKEKARRVRGVAEDASGNSDIAWVPRRLLCRVDVDNCVWVLIEYEESTLHDSGKGKIIDAQWVSFANAQALEDFIIRQPGQPLTSPPRCLSSEDSKRIETEASARVDKVVEEFRRYKVKTDIWKKQKDAETRQLLIHSTSMAANTSRAGATSTGTLGNSIDKALVNTVHALRDTGLGQTTVEELQALKAKLLENETQWKIAYEKLSKDNELLRARGGDALASQWRDRYDALLQEKEELAENVRILSSYSHADTVSGPAFSAGNARMSNPYDAPHQLSTGGNVAANQAHTAPTQRSIEQLYVALKDEYKDYRRRAASLEQQRLVETEEMRRALEEIKQRSGIASSTSSSPTASNALRERIKESSETNGQVSTNLHESKNQYIRQMVLQYLACKDRDVKINIEAALIAMFRFNTEEKAAIATARSTNAEANPMSALAGMFAGIPGLSS